MRPQKTLDEPNAGTSVATKLKSVQEARKALALQHAQNLVQLQRDGGSELARARTAAGLKNTRGAIATRYRNNLPDPTVIHDGDGKPVGNPDLPLVCVPRIDMGGNVSDSKIEGRKRLGYVPVRYREGDKKGQIVESSFGVHMQPGDANVDAEFFIATHPTQGMGAKEYFEAQVAELEKPGLMGIRSHEGNRRDWVEKERENPTANYD